MSKFYLCTEKHCNRKYKTFDKFQNHLLQVHEKIANLSSELVEINQDNKKQVEVTRNNKVEEETKDAKKQEILRRIELEKQAKLEVQSAEIDRYRAIYDEELRQKEVELKKAADLQAIQGMYIQRVEDNKECCLCISSPRDTAILPCGHKFFCYPCITEYHTLDPCKGCPICRGKISMISKIFE